VLTLHGVGDPLMHPGVFEVMRAARAAGVGLVHLRTDALSDAFDPARLLASGLDVLSVDVLAARPRPTERMAGVDRYETVKSRVEAALAERGERRGPARPVGRAPDHAVRRGLRGDRGRSTTGG
jgi:uncharacterized Fe-S cluster-containing radical SAM superfamily enzyme